MISIITPVLDEEDNIRPFFECLNNCKGDFELIIVDGGSTDNTLKVIEDNKKIFKHHLLVLSSRRGRAVQMNKGALTAKGDILLFLHVDTWIENDSLVVIADTLNDNRWIGGGFTHNFSTDDPLLKVLAELGNMRVRTRHIFYGDYGIFIRKKAFDDMGGYDEVPILEDVEFCKKARKFGKLKQISSKLKTSPRRFENIGRLKLSAVFLMALALNMLGKRPGFLLKYMAEK